MKAVVLDTNALLDIFVFNDFRAIQLKEALVNRQLMHSLAPKRLQSLPTSLADRYFP